MYSSFFFETIWLSIYLSGLSVCRRRISLIVSQRSEYRWQTSGLFLFVCLSVCPFHHIPRTWIDHRTGDGMKIIGMGSESGDGVECEVE